MDLWSSRQQAIADLEGDLQPQALALQHTFKLLDATIQRFGQSDLPEPCRKASSLCLAKARHLSLGCYSLLLDSLAQEAGALVRPLIECYELLTYFRKEPARFQLALDGRLPSAGEIAKQIDGKLKVIRDYFNTHASHLSFHEYSIRHLLDHATGEVVVAQPYRRPSFIRNARVLFTVTSVVAAEGIRILQDHIGAGADDLAAMTEACRIAGDKAFAIEEYLRSLDEGSS